MSALSAAASPTPSPQRSHFQHSSQLISAGSDILQLLDVMLISIEPKTRENYSAGLLHFHQFCDSHNIAEDRRMPASDRLLASFIASCAGKVATTNAQSWLARLHFWHNLHGAQGLDLLNTFDAAVFGVACVAFWCCCRLGELVVDSVSSFDSSRHVSHGAPLRPCTLPNQTPFIIIRIPWTKMTHGEGVDIIASKCAGGGWAAMTRPWFLARCNQIWKEAELPELTGHCFCIGGASELLLRGIPPDIVAMQGRWKSRAFLEYWRKIESILPLFVTSSSMDARIALVYLSMDSFAKCYK
ncbi:hypothetical protein BDR05DRAFT_978613 [Suillus weaverae]|nr:hypothetical protein BDR05DRAFT_978613 [Suillus weaverae]